MALCSSSEPIRGESGGLLRRCISGGREEDGTATEGDWVGCRARLGGGCVGGGSAMGKLCRASARIRWELEADYSGLFRVLITDI